MGQVAVAGTPRQRPGQARFPGVPLPRLGTRLSHFFYGGWAVFVAAGQFLEQKNVLRVRKKRGQGLHRLAERAELFSVRGQVPKGGARVSARPKKY